MSDTSNGFSFPDAAERRAFRDRMSRGIERYIPPEMRPFLGLVAESTPSAALERAGAASMAMVAPDRTAMERLGSLGAMLSETAGVAAPVFAGRAVPSAEAAQEMFMGLSAPMRSATETFFERMNQPGEMPERLMSGIDPLAAFRAAREAMLGARSDMSFEDLVDLSGRQAAARDAVVSTLSEAPSVRLFNRDGRAVVVGEGMGPGEDGKFRVTFFDADRRPTNHTVYETKEEALREALNAGYDSRTAAPASTSQSPEEIMRNLRAGADEDDRIRREALDREVEEGRIRMGELPSRITVDDLFMAMGEEGAGTEYPGIGAALDRYVSRSQTPRELAENFNVAINDPDYPLYREALRSNLRQAFGDRPIPVTRTEGYADPNAEKVQESFNISQDDVFFVGSPDERELIARLPDGRVRSVRIADRGPREFARGGEVMMRGNMSKQLEGGIGGFAEDTKNMFRGPRGLEGFAQYMQDGGEITARGLGASQGSTTGLAVAGPGRDVYTGFDGDRLSAVRTRIIRESGVDPVQIAAEEGLDPNLFLNMIAQESGGNARAQSDAGAYGYTQLMDATARELGVDRTDPEQNLRGGARYLRQQIDTFEDIPLALAAYNAGPGAVRRFGGIPPYAETRQYVANILGLPGGQMAVSPTMRPEAVMPVPRPAEEDRFYSGLLPQRNPLNELGEILVSRPANQIPQAQLQQVEENVNSSIMPDQLGGFTDLMRTMP